MVPRPLSARVLLPPATMLTLRIVPLTLARAGLSAVQPSWREHSSGLELDGPALTPELASSKNIVPTVAARRARPPAPCAIVRHSSDNRARLSSLSASNNSKRFSPMVNSRRANRFEVSTSWPTLMGCSSIIGLCLPEGAARGRPGRMLPASGLPSEAWDFRARLCRSPTGAPG